jgi:hypothetical protein
MKITDEIKFEFGQISLNIFNYDVSDIQPDKGSNEWVQVDNGKAGADLRVKYQGPGGERFAAWKSGFWAGYDYTR